MTRRKKLKSLSELLNTYNKTLERELKALPSCLSYLLELEYITAEVGTITGYVLFREGLRLEFQEIIAQEGITIVKRKYSYHVMNKEKELIFRYDNVPHFPKLNSFPHHKHIKNGVVESQNLNLLEVIEEIENLVIGQKSQFS